jgi:hypothetical protein
MTVAKASTAMAVCVSLVPLGLSRRMIRVAVICAWHSARTFTALMDWLVQCVETAHSPATTTLRVHRVQPVQLVSMVPVSRARLLNSLGLTWLHAISFATDVCYAQTLPCSIRRMGGFPRLARCVSLVWLARHPPRRMHCVKSAHQVSIRLLVTVVATVRLAKSRMSLSSASGPLTVRPASTEHIVTTTALRLE